MTRGQFYAKAVVGAPTHDPTTCPHEGMIRQGSDTQSIRILCKECCTRTDTRIREVREKLAGMCNHLSFAKTSIQELASKLLSEQELTKQQTDLTYSFLGQKLKDHFGTHETSVTSTMILTYVEQAIDQEVLN